MKTIQRIYFQNIPGHTRDDKIRWVHDNMFEPIPEGPEVGDYIEIKIETKD